MSASALRYREGWWLNWPGSCLKPTTWFISGWNTSHQARSLANAQFTASQVWFTAMPHTTLEKERKERNKEKKTEVEWRQISEKAEFLAEGTADEATFWPTTGVKDNFWQLEVLRIGAELGEGGRKGGGLISASAVSHRGLVALMRKERQWQRHTSSRKLGDRRCRREG